MGEPSSPASASGSPTKKTSPRGNREWMNPGLGSPGKFGISWTIGRVRSTIRPLRLLLKPP